MIPLTAPVNYLAILACGVVAFVIGALWYSPLLFGTLWAKEHGYTQENMKEKSKSMVQAMIVSFIGYLVTASVLAWLFGLLSPAHLTEALYLIFLLWLGFPLAIGSMTMMYSGISLTAFFIDVAYQFVYLLAMAKILYFWR